MRKFHSTMLFACLLLTLIISPAVLADDTSTSIANLAADGTKSLVGNGEAAWVTVPFDDHVDLPPRGWVVVDFRAGRSQ